jgi:hypothetical protein
MKGEGPGRKEILHAAQTIEVVDPSMKAAGDNCPRNVVRT